MCETGLHDNTMSQPTELQWTNVNRKIKANGKLKIT